MIELARDERIVKEVRKHWFVLLRQLFLLFVLFLLPFVLLGLAKGYGIGSGVSGGWAVLLGTAWFIVFWSRLFSIFTDYYLDSWVITDKRIISIDQKGFFHRETASLRMERIQDITAEIKGLIETLLDFGSLHVQTAGGESDFIIHGIPSPKRVKEIILSQYDPKIDAPSTPTITRQENL